METLVIYGISTLAIVLGFVALLKQKVYIDSNTNQPTEVDIPVVGKLKTNYPSLVFVFLGFCSLLYVFYHSKPKEKVEWTVNGRLVDPQNQIQNWNDGELKVIPSSFKSNVDSQGCFEIQMKLEAGQNFEDVAEAIIYSHKRGNAQLIPKSDTSLLLKRTNHFRSYRPLQLEIIPNN